MLYLTFCFYLVREIFIFVREKSGNFEKLYLWKLCDHLLLLFNRSVLDNFHAAMNAVNDPDIAAVAETLQLAQDAILSDSKQLAGQFVARIYEVHAIILTRPAQSVDQFSLRFKHNYNCFALRKCF